MIGPVSKKQVSILVCSHCDVVKTLNLGGTEKFPKKRKAHYCSHPDLDTQVAYLKKYPQTPNWCPVLAEPIE